MRANQLKAKMALRDYKLKDMGDVLELSTSAISRRMSGEVPFSVAEINKIAEWLSLTDKEINLIFLK